MEWWEKVIVVLGSIATGAAVGGLLGYLILQFTKKRRLTQVVNEIVGNAVKETEDTTPHEQAESKRA